MRRRVYILTVAWSKGPNTTWPFERATGYARPINSGKTCYAVSDAALGAIRTYGTSDFEAKVAMFQAQYPTQMDVYRTAREPPAVPAVLPSGVTAFLSTGQHSELHAAVLKDLVPRFIPSARLLYLGGTANKTWRLDEATLNSVGMPFSSHGKFPDLVFHMEDRGWLVLVEVATSHGPVSPRRRQELEKMLQRCSLFRVYITAFRSRTEFKEYMHDIAWETQVWLADEPGHMIHFNSPKFLRRHKGQDDDPGRARD